MKYLRTAILVLSLLNIPTFALSYISSTLGTVTSYLIILLLGIHFVLDKKKGSPVIPLLILGVGYYVISGFSYTQGSANTFIIELIKYFVVIICGADVVRKTTTKELYFILVAGALSVAINAIFLSTYNANFTENYGRYSGFYLNPNYAGSIALIGLCVSYFMTDKRLRLLGILVCTVGGLFTLSRYFMLIWVVVNLLSVVHNKKNIVGPAIGAGVLVLVFTFASLLQLKADRFAALESIFDSNKKPAQVSGEGRSETWGNYTDIILDSPFVGNGFKTMHGYHFGLRAGVHNTYLMILGEAGLFPFLVCAFLYIFIAKKSFSRFKTEPAYFYFSIVLLTTLLVGHNFFNRFSVLLLSMFIYTRLTDVKPMLASIAQKKETTPLINKQK